MNNVLCEDVNFLSQYPVILSAPGALLLGVLNIYCSTNSFVITYFLLVTSVQFVAFKSRYHCVPKLIGVSFSQMSPQNDLVLSVGGGFLISIALLFQLRYTAFWLVRNWWLILERFAFLKSSLSFKLRTFRLCLSFANLDLP